MFRAKLYTRTHLAHCGRTRGSPPLLAARNPFDAIGICRDGAAGSCLTGSAGRSHDLAMCSRSDTAGRGTMRSDPASPFSRIAAPLRSCSFCPASRSSYRSWITRPIGIKSLKTSSDPKGQLLWMTVHRFSDGRCVALSPCCACGMNHEINQTITGSRARQMEPAGRADLRVSRCADRRWLVRKPD